MVYTYDSGTNGIGRLSQMSDLSGSSAFSYDVMGHIIQTDKIVDGTTYTTKTQYDYAGRVSAIAYPDNPTVYSIQYEYNGPVLKRVYEGAINHVQYSGHNGLGQPGTASYANGVTTTYTYSNSGNSTCPQDNYRLCTQRTVHGGSPTYQDLRYTYYNVGNVNQITDNLDASNTQTFTYDELNRLLTAQATVYGTITYTYNEVGNMMTNSQVGSYVYPLSGIRPHAVTTAGGNSYIYDDNGNMTSGAGRQITYDYDNRPFSIIAGGVTTTFLYDGGGARVKKTSNGVSTVYIGKLYENTPDGCIKYIFAGDQRIAMRDVAGSLFYYHTDHLGSSSVITDAAGNMVERLAYFPYGQNRINTGSKDVHHKFTGQELDGETGLYFYGARYYDPQLGRFISADSVVPNPGNPQDLNRYSYVSNNPLNYIDPTGHSWFSKFLHDIEDGAKVVGGLILIAASPACGPAAGACAGAGVGLTASGVKGLGGQVEVGFGGSVDSGGNISAQGYDLETGATYPYMPISAASVSVSDSNGGYFDTYSWIGVPAIGGDGNCTRCMPEDVALPGEYWQLDYHSMFDGDEVITSSYGWRSWDNKFHGGIDVAPRPQTGDYGIPLYAPSNGHIIGVSQGGIYFRSIRFSSSLFFYHVSLSPNLSERVLPIHVYAGTQIGTIEKIGTTTNPHVHIQIENGGKLYNEVRWKKWTPK